MNQRQLAERIGNVEEDLVHRAGEAPNYAAGRRRR